MTRIAAFDYPANPHLRRHGPAGYDDYESYRDWLRDEWTFRCVFCLHRERWTQGGYFHIDHLEPVATAPHRVCDYENLLYVCVRCNLLKGNARLPDPCAVALDAIGCVEPAPTMIKRFSLRPRPLK